MDWYFRKFPIADTGLLLRALAWLDDAEQEPDPVALDGNSRVAMKQKITGAVRDFQIF